MERYMEIRKGCQLYKDYFEWDKNLKEANNLFGSIKEKYGIESVEYYLLKNGFKIIPTENDNKKFASMLKKTSYGEFKKNTDISKEWINGVKKIGIIEKPQLFYYLDLLGYKWRERLFHIRDKLYCSIESDGEVSVPRFALEMKASEFYKIIEEGEGN